MRSSGVRTVGSVRVAPSRIWMKNPAMVSRPSAVLRASSAARDGSPTARLVAPALPSRRPEAVSPLCSGMLTVTSERRGTAAANSTSALDQSPPQPEAARARRTAAEATRLERITHHGPELAEPEMAILVDVVVQVLQPQARHRVPAAGEVPPHPHHGARGPGEHRLVLLGVDLRVE